jgi:thiopurine S-methyltransferase
MQPEFWQARWSEGRIGFHEGRPNALLERHVGALSGVRRVLVPLCGKAVDLAFLASRGFEVVGVELVEAAVAAFFAERGLVPTVERVGSLVRYRHDAVELLAGDFFDVTRDHAGRCDGCYDRAALIALPSEMRRRYVAHLRGLLDPGARGLVITVDYPQERMEGPPFAVPEAELLAHYRGAHVERLEEVRAVSPNLAVLEGVERAHAVRL